MEAKVQVFTKSQRFELNEWIFYVICSLVLVGIAVLRFNEISKVFSSVEDSFNLLLFLNREAFILITAFAILAIPFMFMLLLGRPPFSHFRILREMKVREEEIILEKIKAELQKEEMVDEIKNIMQSIEEQNNTPEGLLNLYVKQSEKLASEIHDRAKFFILVGGSIAIIGILFFFAINSRLPSIYSSTLNAMLDQESKLLDAMLNTVEKSDTLKVGGKVYVSIDKTDIDKSIEYNTGKLTKKPDIDAKVHLSRDKIDNDTSMGSNLGKATKKTGIDEMENSKGKPFDYVSVIQRFSILFFIELIAFFFLRQHRVMMEEFRYYETLKRKRQDNQFIFTLANHYEDKPETLKILLEKLSLTDPRFKLGANESTEVLEAQKIKEEMLPIDKLIDTLKDLKKS